MSAKERFLEEENKQLREEVARLKVFYFDNNIKNS